MVINYMPEDVINKGDLHNTCFTALRGFEGHIREC